MLPHKVQVRVRLDTFGGNLYAEFLAERGKRRKDAPRLVERPCLTDQFEVDLDFGDGQVGELDETALALPEIVER